MRFAVTSLLFASVIASAHAAPLLTASVTRESQVIGNNMEIDVKIAKRNRWAFLQFCINCNRTFGLRKNTLEFDNAYFLRKHIRF